MQMIEKVYQLNAKTNLGASDNGMLVGSRFPVFQNVFMLVFVDINGKSALEWG